MLGWRFNQIYILYQKVAVYTFPDQDCSGFMIISSVKYMLSTQKWTTLDSIRDGGWGVGPKHIFDCTANFHTFAVPKFEKKNKRGIKGLYLNCNYS